MVVGFNIRPVARLCKQLGYRVIAVDYWGDIDIRNCAHHVYSVLQQGGNGQPDSILNGSRSEALVNLANRAAEELGHIDFILVGSGLDDRPDLWARLARIAPVLGNTPERLMVARNLMNVFSIAEDEGVRHPATERARSPDEAIKLAEKMGFPVVLKPMKGSGGFRIRFGRNPAEIKENYGRVAGRSGEVWVQKYINGVDASASILGDGRDCVVISVNEQLIGLREVGALSPFRYCGNIVPLKANRKVIERVREVSCVLGQRLRLIGSNGLDFVIGRDGEPYLMEVNPRFQGTLECIYYSTGLNLVKAHIEACRGSLIREIPKPKRYAAKMIVFAKSQGVIPRLDGLRDVYDISLPGTPVKRGSPICTVQVKAKSRGEAFDKALRITKKIYEALNKAAQKLDL